MAINVGSLSSFPSLVYATQSISFQPNIKYTRYSTGRTRSRRHGTHYTATNSRADGVEVIASVTLDLTESQYSTFVTFWEDTINHGEEMFAGPLWLQATTNPQTVACQIIEGTYSARLKTVGASNNTFWVVSYDFEVKELDLSEHETIYGT